MEKKSRSRGRPVLNEKEKMDRQRLKELFIENSEKSFNTILYLMEHAMDYNLRFKCASFIINKIIPDGYIGEEKIDNNLNFNIVVKKSTPLDIINANTECEDSDNWNEDDSDEWGTDVYISK